MVSKTNKEHLLVIANASTHHKKPRGIQVNRLLIELSEYYRIVLITAERSVPEPGIEYFEGRLEDIHVVKESGRKLMRISSLLWNFLGTMDFLYAFRAFITSKKVLKEKKICRVLCLSMRNAFTGVLLKKYFKNHVIIVSFYSDPVADNPYMVNSGLSRKLTGLIEKTLFCFSDKNIFPSLSMTNFYKIKYSELKDRFFYIPHSFIPVFNSESHSINDINKKFIIRHIGSINELRNPFQMIDYISENGIMDLLENKNIYFEFYGRYSHKVRNELLKYKSDHFLFMDEISYEKTNLLHQTADALLVIDANISPSYFLPSKLIEILPYRKPVIILTPCNSESSRIGEILGQYILYYNEMKSIPTILESILIHRNHYSDISDFEIVNVAMKYSKCIESF